MMQVSPRVHARVKEQPSPAPEILGSVLCGLQQTPKRLSPIWFYDERGSQLFDRICESPEYYVTRTELQIMHRHAAGMARHIGSEAVVIEPGSGTSMKTRLLLDRLDSPRIYAPIDIARDHLLEAAGAIAHDYPWLDVVPLCADFSKPLALPARISANPHRVVYFPGSTLGNFERREAIRLLSHLRILAGRPGGVLIGIDLRKDPAVLERAYNDAAGYTGQFNLNALKHLNRRTGADFDPARFRHRAIWMEEQSRIEMHLVSVCDQSVTIGGQRIRFACGEHLRTECSHKYSMDGFSTLARAAGLAVTDAWLDAGRKFSVQWLTSIQ